MYCMQFNIYNPKTYVKQCVKIPKRAITNRECKKDRQYNGRKKKDKQWSTKHYTDNC